VRIEDVREMRLTDLRRDAGQPIHLAEALGGGLDLFEYIRENKWGARVWSKNLRHRWLLNKAQEMRLRPTEAEDAMALILSSLDVEWRAQHVLGGYILDFYLAQFRLGIEVDGSSHNSLAQLERDDLRDGRLERLGLTIIRFRNADVLYADWVPQRILNYAWAAA